MRAKVLLTKAATRAKVLAGIRAAARRLKKGDLFLLTYSGHGGQVPDVTGEEADSRDETWCLFDGELIDDELYFALSRFAAGRPDPRAVGQLPQWDRDASTRECGRRPHAALPDDASRQWLTPPIGSISASTTDCSGRSPRRRWRVRACDPDSVLSQLLVKPRLDADRGKVPCRVDPHLGMPGQPDVDGRRSQRRIHRSPARRLG